jgi:glutathione S-transferase
MASSAMLQVFGQPASTDVARVMACLLERQLDFELVRTDTFKRGHNKLPEFVKMRARSKIPETPADRILIGSLHQVWILFLLI